MFQTLRSSIFLYRLAALLCFSLFVPAVGATSNISQDTTSEITDKAIELELWKKTEWLNLGHYNKEFGSYKSQVNDDRFFYTKDGREDPEAELLETLKQLFIKNDDDNQQTQCRFIARADWLTAELEIDKDLLPKVSCDKYQKWRGITIADSVTMIFPAYHLNSPSSMFGHTLLRLDDTKNPSTEWMSTAVNFGANINNDDNSIIYAYRGLAGGYPGLFVTDPYFKKIQEYNRIEHRDIWEYKLNLTEAETERMIQHMWELDTINFDYFFLDENCSYRLLELIEVARPGVELTDEFVLTAIPVDTVRAMENAGLVESVSYRPAQATEIQYIIDHLPQQQRDIVSQLAEDISITETEAFTALPAVDQKKILDVTYKYLRYENTETHRDPEIAKRSYQLLQKLSTYSADIDITSKPPRPYPPEKGHKSKRTTFGTGERLSNQYAELGFKMALHDLEDNKDGFLQGAQINIINAKIRLEDNVGLRLYELNIIDVFSLTPRNDFFKPLSWKVFSGFERQLTYGKDQLVYQLSGGAGGTWEIIKNHQFHALAIGRLEINKQLKNFFEPGIGFTSGFLSHFKSTTARLEFSGELLQEDVYRLRVEYIQNFVLSTNDSIRLSAKHQWQDNNVEFSDVSLNYQHYF